MEVPVSMIIRKKALKQPKKKSLKVRAQRIKVEMAKIREDQICIRQDQRNIREKFEVINFECDQLREETERIMKQSACARIQLSLMLDILKACKDGDFVKADTVAHVLKVFSNSRGSSNGEN
ncbi:hypothetical protein PTKIN_Ptkin14bG0092300 [Pterospermum kingtungense]